MRIVVVNFSYDLDAVDADALLSRYHSLTGWCEALADAGSSVTAVQRFHTNATITRGGVEYCFYDDASLGDPRPPIWLRACQRLVGRANPDVVHVNGLNWPAQTWLLRRALPARAAIVVQDHAGGEPDAIPGSYARTVRRFVRRRLMRAADGFFFTARAQADSWRRVGLIGAHQPSYQVLEASTTLKPAWRAVARQDTGVQGDPAVLWVGRLNANKDPLTVLDGFERCLDRLPGATLSMIYSAADLLQEVGDRIRTSPALAARVRLVGRVPRERMAEFYSAADLFVLGSHHESCGYSLIEACACGVPSVVTDIPTFRAITGDAAIGALWWPGDAQACAAALARVAGRSALESREHVLEHFDRELSWPAVAKAATDAYADICARRRGESA